MLSTPGRSISSRQMLAAMHAELVEARPSTSAVLSLSKGSGRIDALEGRRSGSRTVAKPGAQVGSGIDERSAIRSLAVSARSQPAQSSAQWPRPGREPAASNPA